MWYVDNAPLNKGLGAESSDSRREEKRKEKKESKKGGYNLTGVSRARLLGRPSLFPSFSSSNESITVESLAYCQEMKICLAETLQIGWICCHFVTFLCSRRMGEMGLKEELKGFMSLRSAEADPVRAGEPRCWMYRGKEDTPLLKTYWACLHPLFGV